MTDCGAWREWHRRCALDLCSECARRELAGFALARFRKYARGYAARTNSDAAGIAGLTEREAWHRFETHLLVTNTREGKAYKEWLMARGHGSDAARRELIESGASLIMREVVREHIRTECSPATVVSLDAPFPGTGSGNVPFAEFLPGGIDPSETAAIREMEKLARRHASEILAQIDRREKAALLARASRRSFGDPSVRKAAGCGKSRLKEIYGELVEKIAAKLRLEHPGEDRAALFQLALMTHRSLNEMIFSKKRAAYRRVSSFSNSEDRRNTGKAAAAL